LLKLTKIDIDILVDKNKISKLKKDKFYFVINIILKRKNKKSKIISKFQIEINLLLDKFNANLFNIKFLLLKNRFMQFKIFTILIIFEDSRTSQKLKIEKKSKKVITTKTIKIKAIKIKIREKKATCKRAQKQIKKIYTIFLDKNKSN